MTPRQLRRAAERTAKKAARKSGFANPTTSTISAAEPSSPAQTAPPPPYSGFLNRVKAEAAAANDPGPLTPLDISEPGFPFPSLTSMSPARAEASRTNGALSQGPLTPATKSISAQNHTVHGLARHDQTNFKTLTCEDAAAFIALHQLLLDEHQPTTPTETILVQTMAQSHWLVERSQRLQDTCIDPDTGAFTDEKKFTLYMRYQTTHKRSSHKSLNDLTKLRSEKRKAELGFEAQKVAQEKHEMKKQSLYWDILKKDATACQELSRLAAQNTDAGRAIPGFEAKYEEELAKRGLTKNHWEAAAKAAS
jgi:hypothetical protein